MRERGQRLCFAQKALAGHMPLAVQHLQRHRLAVHPITPAEHHAHAPAAHERLALEALAETPRRARHARRLISSFVQAFVLHGTSRGIPRKEAPPEGRLHGASVHKTGSSGKSCLRLCT